MRVQMNFIRGREIRRKQTLIFIQSEDSQMLAKVHW